MTEACGSCRYFMTGEKLCRRFPPKVFVRVLASQTDPGIAFSTQSFFPAMDPEKGWCGEYTKGELT